MLFMSPVGSAKKEKKRKSQKISPGDVGVIAVLYACVFLDL